MSKYTNVSPGKLVLPDMTNVAPNQSATIDSDLRKHPIVAGWIKDGILVSDAKLAARAKLEADEAAKLDEEAAKAAEEEAKRKAEQEEAERKAAEEKAAKEKASSGSAPKAPASK